LTSASFVFVWRHKRTKLDSPSSV